ncbi:hypothetical protein D3C78_1835540 [compost metagenome]
MVLDAVPETDLSGTSVLLMLGARDAFRPQGERLAEALHDRGADVTIHIVDAGHELGALDAPAVAEWLADQAAFGPT